MTWSPSRLPTVAIGMIGGVIVGLTSVGSGSLMIVLLLFLYPMIGANRLVGTDLTQAVPLTLAAALGALVIVGHVKFGVTISIVIGSVPAVLIGSLLSSRAPDKILRPVITFVIFASGLKYVGVGTTALGWTLAAVLAASLAVWLAWAQPWRGRAAGTTPGPSPAAAVMAPRAAAAREATAAAGDEPRPPDRTIAGSEVTQGARSASPPTARLNAIGGRALASRAASRPGAHGRARAAAETS